MQNCCTFSQREIIHLQDFQLTSKDIHLYCNAEKYSQIEIEIFSDLCLSLCLDDRNFEENIVLK